jgi:hypothetical protein
MSADQCGVAGIAAAPPGQDELLGGDDLGLDE